MTVLERIKQLLGIGSEPKPYQAKPAEETKIELSENIEQNIEKIQSLFTDVDILVCRRFGNTSGSAQFCLFHCDGVVNSRIISDDIIDPLIDADFTGETDLADRVVNRCVRAGEARQTDDMNEIISGICYGDTLLFINGCKTAVMFNSKMFSLRSISEPESEKVLTGPREGFTEGIMLNLSMLRRRIQTNKLKMRFLTVGRNSGTRLCISYVDGIVNMDIVNELHRRLESINIDAVLDSNYLVELVCERSFLGFSSTGVTERPDVVAGKLMEGRVAVFVDGSPVVLTLPFLFIENFQSNEDYYTDYHYASFTRILRIAGFLLTIIVPALYVSIEAYNQEILPLPLLINIVSERGRVPLSAAAEAFVMLMAFDVLREAGIRMPSQVGQALSIVGALVIGQAAVSAGMIAAPMLIVVAFAGITGMLIPKLNGPIIICRYIFLIFSSTMGMAGIVVGASILLTHILSLASVGMPQVTQVRRFGVQDVKDTFIRASWRSMYTRISALSRNRTRMRNGKRG